MAPKRQHLIYDAGCVYGRYRDEHHDIRKEVVLWIVEGTSK